MPITVGRLAVAAAVVGVIAIGVAVTGPATPPDDTTPIAVASTGAPDPRVELSGPAPTQSDLLGIWDLDQGRVLVRFAADGTYAVDADGDLPVVRGR